LDEVIVVIMEISTSDSDGKNLDYVQAMEKSALN
jgi:hypothetical protein